MCHLALYSGVDFKVKVMEAAGPDGRPKRVKVTIWDTGHNKKNFVAMHSEVISSFVSWSRAIPNSYKFILQRSSRDYTRCVDYKLPNAF
jgi:hypothetical protein